MSFTHKKIVNFFFVCFIQSLNNFQLSNSLDLNVVYNLIDSYWNVSCSFTDQMQYSRKMPEFEYLKVQVQYASINYDDQSVHDPVETIGKQFPTIPTIRNRNRKNTPSFEFDSEQKQQISRQNKNIMFSFLYFVRTFDKYFFIPRNVISRENKIRVVAVCTQQLWLSQVQIECSALCIFFVCLLTPTTTTITWTEINK